MKPYSERLAEAKGVHQKGLDRVASTPMPILQKYPPGTFVWIAKDLGEGMSHFQNNRPAKVQYTYAHAYEWDDSPRAAKQYSLLVRYDDGSWSSIAWYYESQLTEIDRFRCAEDIEIFEAEIANSK